MIDLDNQTTLNIDISALENIADSLSTRDVELIIVDDTTIRSLNLEHRGKDTTTDVLSFPLETPFTPDAMLNIPLGSIIVAASYVQREAKVFGHTEQDELSLLFIHGMLHLLGFDHEVDDGEMREKEKAIIEQFALPTSLILRMEN